QSPYGAGHVDIDLRVALGEVRLVVIEALHRLEVDARPLVRRRRWRSAATPTSTSSPGNADIFAWQAFISKCGDFGEPRLCELRTDRRSAVCLVPRRMLRMMRPGEVGLEGRERPDRGFRGLVRRDEDRGPRRVEMRRLVVVELGRDDHARI